MEEKYYIRRFAKVISEEGKDVYYWFNIQKYIRLYSKIDFKYETLKAKYELVEADEEKNFPSPKTIGRIMGFFNGEKESGKQDEAGKKKKTDKAITIETAKALGKALCNGDPYGLLIKIEPSNVMMIMKQAEQMWGTSDVNYIYGLMNNLLYELESSSYYSYKPGTTEDGFEHYDMMLQNIRNEIDSRFWNKKEVREKLYHLVDEEEMLIKSYSQPGAPERWMLANPRLRYFDCVFEIMEENPELYENIKAGAMTTGWGQAISFNFYPTKQECEERREYFKELITKDRMQNSQYSWDRFYQNELINAFSIVFNKDFEDLNY